MDRADTEKNRSITEMIRIPAAVLLGYLALMAALASVHTNGTDFHGHTYVYMSLFTERSFADGWMAVPYCLWHMITLGVHKLFHIPMDYSAAYTGVFFFLASVFISEKMIRSYLEYKQVRKAPQASLLAAVGLSLIQGIHLDWVQAGERYLGLFSMNPFHNPTQMCVKPFGYIAFGLILDIWRRTKKNPEAPIFFPGAFGKEDGKNTKAYVIFGFILFLSTLAKPTFAEMLIPAAGIVMAVNLVGKLITDRKDAGRYFMLCLKMLAAVLPALIYILVSALGYFLFGGSFQADSSVMITRPFEVWRFFSDNCILSIFLGMAFPLYMLLIDGKYFTGTDEGKLAFAGYLTGLVQAVFLGEGGIKFSYGNFMWTMMSGMQLFWLMAVSRLCTLEEKAAETKGKRIALGAGWVLFALHVLCGIIYIVEMGFLHKF